MGARTEIDNVTKYARFGDGVPKSILVKIDITNINIFKQYFITHILYYIIKSNFINI